MFSPEEFAKIVVRTNEHYPECVPTFSATDLKKMDNLAGAINNFSKAILASDTKEDKIINSAVSHSEHYGDTTYPYSEYHDLHSSCRYGLVKKLKTKILKKSCR